MQSWGLQLACQISHCFKSLAWQCTADVERGVPSSGKKRLAATQDVLDSLLQAASRYPRSLSLKTGFYRPVPFPLALVTWFVLANEMRADVILPLRASLNLFYLPQTSHVPDRGGSSDLSHRQKPSEAGATANVESDVRWSCK